MKSNQYLVLVYMNIWYIANIWSKLEEERKKKIEKYFINSCLRELKKNIRSINFILKYHCGALLRLFAPLEFQVPKRTPRFKLFTQALNPSGCTAPPIVFNVPCDGHRSLESCHTWKAYHWSQIVCTLSTSHLAFIRHSQIRIFAFLWFLDCLEMYSLIWELLLMSLAG